MARIVTKIVKGMRLYNNTDKDIEVKISSKSEEGKFVKLKISIGSGKYSEAILLGKYGFEKYDMIVFDVTWQGVIFKNAEPMRYMYHPGGECNVNSIHQIDEMMVIQHFANTFKAVRFSNHSATVSKFAIAIEKDQYNHKSKGREVWRCGSKSVGYGDYIDLTTLGEDKIPELSICYPVADVFWSSNAYGEIFVYSSDSDYTISYELRGTAFSKKFTAYAK
ncbi:MAG: hypothetical protein ACRCSG_07375 [Cellulosilyticaceae bacterium]